VADVIVEPEVDRLAGQVQGDAADLPVAGDRPIAPAVPDRGDNIAGVLTLIRRAVLEPGGDSVSGALTLMRDELERAGGEDA
jgi:hypothetical protein